MRGHKINEDLKEQAIALLLINNNVSQIARDLNLPYSTVNSWFRELNKEDSTFYAKIREQRRKKFIDKAWNIIDKAQTKIETKLDDNKNVPVRDLAVIVGTMYDKQALANQEATQIVTGNMQTVVKFEDL